MPFCQETREKIFCTHLQLLKRWAAEGKIPKEFGGSTETEKLCRLAWYASENDEGIYERCLEKINPQNHWDPLKKEDKKTAPPARFDDFLLELQIGGMTEKFKEALSKQEDPNKTGGIPNWAWATILVILAFFTLSITPPAKRLVDHIISSEPSIATSGSIHAPTNARPSPENIKKLSDDINILKSIIEIEARLDDTYSTVEAVGLSAGLFGVLITIITIFFALKESERVKDAINRINTLENLANKMQNAEEQVSLIEKRVETVSQLTKDLIVRATEAATKAAAEAAAEAKTAAQEAAQAAREAIERTSRLENRLDQKPITVKKGVFEAIIRIIQSLSSSEKENITISTKEISIRSLTDNLREKLNEINGLSQKDKQFITDSRTKRIDIQLIDSAQQIDSNAKALELASTEGYDNYQAVE